MILRLFLSLLILTTGLFGDVQIIGIAGGTGSGKTTLARKLKELLGEKLTIIEQDNYYKDLPDLSADERSKQNFDHPDSIDFELLAEHLYSLKEGNRIEQPLYNFATNSRRAETKETHPSPIILVEGCLLFADPTLRELFDLKIFVEVDTDIRLLRRIERDQLCRGRSLESILTQYLTFVRPMHEEYVSPSKSFADVIIFGEGENKKVLNLLMALQ